MINTNIWEVLVTKNPHGQTWNIYFADEEEAYKFYELVMTKKSEGFFAYEPIEILADRTMEDYLASDHAKQIGLTK